MPNIVNVVVTQQVASAPSTLQRTGALISQGGTNLSAGSTQLLTSASDLTAILNPAKSISAISWAAGTVSVTTGSPHGIPSGQTVEIVVSGCDPVGYNGTFAGTSTGTNTLTYPLVSDPGVIITEGSLTIANTAILQAMVNTFFAQGNQTPVYVLELGATDVNNGVTALTTYLLNPSVRFYSYLLPYNWDNNTNAQALFAEYEGTTAQTYFYVSTTLATYSFWEGMKSVFATLPNPAAPSTEFSAAAIFQVTLTYNPNASNLAHPLEYSYVYGVTQYTSALTNTQQTQLLTAGMNWIGTGAQGGISNTLIEGGTFADLNPFNYWYSTDWTAINVQIALSAAIINGSNLPTNPLYYNQAGINTLQKVAQARVNDGISFGLILSPATVQAVPFVTYVAQNPGDYATGTYNGLSLTFVPLRGFSSITIYLTASNIPV